MTETSPTARKKKSSYTEQDIDVLKGLEPVQRRPGMYTRTDSPNHIIQEIVDNAQDEALAGFASNISVELHDDGSISAEDDGRGIPVGIHPTEKKPVIEVVFTSLHAGGKFNKGDGQTYGFTGGLHGVGVSVTNALSSRLEVTVYRDGYRHDLVFADGAVIEPLSRKRLPPEDKEKTGTRVRSWPNPKYFENANLQTSEMERYLRSKAVLLKGVRMSWLRPDRAPMVWSFPGGLTEYLGQQAGDEALWVAPMFHLDASHAETTAAFERGEGFELAVGWLADGRAARESYVNLIHTAEGGRHETGLRAGLLDALRAVAERTGAMPKGLRLEPDDVWGSMSFVLSAKLMDPQFQNQTKDKMTSEKGHRLVAGLLRDPFELWLNENPLHARAILDVLIASAIRRSKTGQKADRKRAVGASVLPGKLSDCETKDVEIAELFLVEGDSAGGCFFSLEIIELADNQRLTIKEIADQQAAGKRHFGYTLDKGLNVGIAELKNARLTKHAAELVAVVLDTGEEIKCTPDHLFMLRDGSYCRADQLTHGTSLMPFRIKATEKNKNRKRCFHGYHQVLNPKSGRWKYAHILADEWNIENGVYEKPEALYHRHHVDFEKLNNDPRNILAMSPREHLAIHLASAECGLHTEQSKLKSKLAKQTPEFRVKQSARMKEEQTRAILSEQAIAQWKDPEYKDFMAKAWKEHYNSNPAYRQMNSEQLDRIQREYWASEEHRLAQSERVKKYFNDNPSHRAAHSQASIEQWDDPQLLAWRAEETKKQWTPEFRAQRQKAMDQHYYQRTMAVLRTSWELYGDAFKERYDEIRKPIADRYIMKLPKFTAKFFDGNPDTLADAVANHNHKVVKVVPLPGRHDVYDLEVPGTHNFALASGVFVHNSSKQGRNRTTQAILPLRGKLLNTWDVDRRTALTSDTIHDIASAIGIDAHSANETPDMSRLRYGKVFIMADADVDGQHIQVLLLTLFLRHFPALIRGGHVWIAQAPLFRIDAPAKKGSKTGPRKIYAIDEKELQAVQAQLQKEGLTDNQYSVARFKGLGEMNASQLGETTMNPDGRRALRVDLADAQAAEIAFDRMMAKKSVKQRKDWMEAEGGRVEID